MASTITIRTTIDRLIANFTLLGIALFQNPVVDNFAKPEKTALAAKRYLELLFFPLKPSANLPGCKFGILDKKIEKIEIGKTGAAPFREILASND